jgi:hypothetical protein
MPAGPIELTTLPLVTTPATIQDDDVVILADNTAAPAPYLTTIITIINRIRLGLWPTGLGATNTVMKVDDPVAGTMKASNVEITAADSVVATSLQSLALPAAASTPSASKVSYLAMFWREIAAASGIYRPAVVNSAGVETVFNFPAVIGAPVVDKSIPRYNGTTGSELGKSNVVISNTDDVMTPATVFASKGVATLKSATAPTIPALGSVRIFAGADGRVRVIDDSGTITVLTVGGVQAYDVTRDYVSGEFATRGSTLWLCRAPNGPGTAVIDPTLDAGNTIWAPASQLNTWDYIVATGRVRTGAVVSPNGANLRLNVSSGQLFYPNEDAVAKFPVAARLQTAMQHYVQNGTLLGAITNDLNVAQYDVGTVATAIPVGKHVNHRIYIDQADNIKVLLGQYTHNSLVEAQQAIGAEQVIVPASFANDLLLAVVSVRAGTAVLNDLTLAGISPTSRQGDILSGGNLNVALVGGVSYVKTTNGMTVSVGGRYIAMAGHAVNVPIGTVGQEVRFVPFGGAWAPLAFGWNEPGGWTIGAGQVGIPFIGGEVTLVADPVASNWIVIA